MQSNFGNLLKVLSKYPHSSSHYGFILQRDRGTAYDVAGVHNIVDNAIHLTTAQQSLRSPLVGQDHPSSDLCSDNSREARPTAQFQDGFVFEQRSVVNNVVRHQLSGRPNEGPQVFVVSLDDGNGELLVIDLKNVIFLCCHVE